MLTLDGGSDPTGILSLSTALALSVATRTPFHMRPLSAGKGRGLSRELCDLVRAVAVLGNAEAQGLQPGVDELVFVPQTAQSTLPRVVRMPDGGNVPLALLIALPGLCEHPRATRVLLEGCTHTPGCPGYGFLAEGVLPVWNRMGPRISTRLVHTAFSPSSEGAVDVEVDPQSGWNQLDLLKRGSRGETRVLVSLSRLPAMVAGRALKVLETKLRLEKEDCRIRVLDDARGWGMSALVTAACEHACAVFECVGEQELSPEQLASRLAREIRIWLRARVPVSTALAEHLLVPFVLAGRGKLRTSEPTQALRIRAATIRQFLGIECGFKSLGKGVWDIEIGVDDAL